MSSSFVDRAEALSILNVKAGTLYAYVSRGKVKTKPHADGRRSLYLRADLERLSNRKRGRPQRSMRSDPSTLWSEPVIASSITQIHEDGPVYRRRSSAEMCRAGISFETVAHMLFTGVWNEDLDAWPLIETPHDTLRLLAASSAGMNPGDISKLLGVAAFALGMRDRGTSEITQGTTVPGARLLIQTMAGCLGYLSSERAFAVRNRQEGLATFILRASTGREIPSSEARRAMNGALIMLADHELAPSTFAVRVAASTNTDIFNCIATAIGAHAGFSTGTATQNIERFLFPSAGPEGMEYALRMVAEYGKGRFGFNHPMYPEGDPRADMIIELITGLRTRADGTDRILDFLQTARTALGARPGIAAALVALTRALSMPDGSAAGLLILSRTTGWIAHILEQRAQSILLRPRARFIDTDPSP